MRCSQEEIKVLFIEEVIWEFYHANKTKSNLTFTNQSNNQWYSKYNHFEFLNNFELFSKSLFTTSIWWQEIRGLGQQLYDDNDGGSKFLNFNEILEKKNCLGQNILLLEAKNSFRVERVKVVNPSIKMITMEIGKRPQGNFFCYSCQGRDNDQLCTQTDNYVKGLYLWI